MEEKKRILIVEDERAIVEILKFNLMREGYDTLEALDGELGLELARTKDPDLILLDVMLPKPEFKRCGKHRPHHHAHRARRGDRQGLRPRSGS